MFYGYELEEHHLSKQKVMKFMFLLFRPYVDPVHTLAADVPRRVKYDTYSERLTKKSGIKGWPEI